MIDEDLSSNGETYVTPELTEYPPLTDTVATAVSLDQSFDK